jgi:hypothetical protein
MLTITFSKKVVLKLQEYNNTGPLRFHQDRPGRDRFQKSIYCSTRPERLTTFNCEKERSQPNRTFYGKIKKGKTF